MTEAERTARAEPSAIRRPVRRRYWLVGCGVALGLLAAAVTLGWFYWYESQRRPAVAPVQGMLDASGPPLGSSIAEVKNWLDAHDMPIAEADLGKNRDALPAGDPDLKRAKTVVMGTMFDAHVDPNFKGDLYIIFYFDGDGRLFKRVIKEWPQGS